jgi:hypothetical protein
MSARIATSITMHIVYFLFLIFIYGLFALTYLSLSLCVLPDSTTLRNIFPFIHCLGLCVCVCVCVYHMSVVSMPGTSHVIIIIMMIIIIIIFQPENFRCNFGTILTYFYTVMMCVFVGMLYGVT